MKSVYRTGGCAALVKRQQKIAHPQSKSAPLVWSVDHHGSINARLCAGEPKYKCCVVYANVLNDAIKEAKITFFE